MTTYIVIYFYPDGSYAGIIGGCLSQKDADTLITQTKMNYSDCTFITCKVEVS